MKTARYAVCGWGDLQTEFRAVRVRTDLGRVFYRAAAPLLPTIRIRRRRSDGAWLGYIEPLGKSVPALDPQTAFAYAAAEWWLPVLSEINNVIAG